ncbi:MAG: hypothetical protein CMN30_04910 [Sandaracinus sp.]|nr:hypothetical protein [Sandaracinus sp.]
MTFAARFLALFGVLSASACGGRFRDDDDDRSRPTCAVADRTLTCFVSEDPDPDVVDDESTTTLEITLAEGALDDAPRVIEATTDFADIGFDGELVDEARLEGLEPGAAHDADVVSALLYRRSHRAGVEPVYVRVLLEGDVAFDTDGDYDVDVTWTGPEGFEGELRGDD